MNKLQCSAIKIQDIGPDYLVGVDVVKLGDFDQGAGDGGGLSPALRTHKQIVLAAQTDATHGAFGGALLRKWVGFPLRIQRGSRCG